MINLYLLIKGKRDISIRINVMREGRLKEVCGEQVANHLIGWITLFLLFQFPMKNLSLTQSLFVEQFPTLVTKLVTGRRLVTNMEGKLLDGLTT